MRKADLAHRRVRRRLVLCCTLLQLVSGIALAPAALAAPRADDAALVYCLAGARRSQLIEAAVALGPAQASRTSDLALDGRALTLEEWRRERPADFAAACTALAETGLPAGADAPDSHRVVSVLTSLAQLFAGAALTWIVTTLRDGENRRRERATALRSAVRAYVVAAEAYLREINGNPASRPDDRAAQDRGVELALELHRAERAGGDASAAAARLDAAPLGTALGRGWLGRDDGRAAEVRTALRALESDAETAARSVERPRWRRRGASGTPITVGDGT